ncbi:MAG: 4Fe-4S cluster-binding domain-containing protein, partial [Candidatus Kariarchaeaceae archaeon]
MYTFTSFADLKIWDNSEISENLDWYFKVSNNKMPAKYLICKRIKCNIPLDSDLELLWEEHANITSELINTIELIQSGNLLLTDLDISETSLLDLNEELVKRMLQKCNFCEWNCGIDRNYANDAVKSSSGTCQLGLESRVGSYFHHRGEELIFRGTLGSGTVFFTSCCLRCTFCQNGDISKDKKNGRVITPKQLGYIGSLLRLEGVHNINFVGGDPVIHLHTIIQSIQHLDFHDFTKISEDELRMILQIKSDNFISYELNKKFADYLGEFNVPLLWNSNFYMSLDTMKILRTVIDIWLPDFKFGNNDCARRLSRTPRYFETISRNHKLIYSWGENMAIRHLIMPNHVECCSEPIMDWIRKEIPQTPVNIMDQYHPDSFAKKGSPKYNNRYE